MKEYVDNYNEIGINKVHNKWYKTFILGIMAGAFIAFAANASIVVSHGINSASISKLLSGIVFPIGLMLVILFKTELFTGNSLLMIPLLSKKIKIKDLLKNWLLVYLGNLVGAFLVALCIYLSSQWSMSNNLLGIATVKTAIAKVSPTFIESFSLGILCNILVCSAVILAINVKDIVSKILVIFFPIMLFIVMGLEHSVANMYYLSAGLLAKTNDLYTVGLSNINKLNVETIWIKNLIPVTLGNIIGGALLATIIWFLSKEKNKM